MIRRLAILATHPIQYLSPFYKLLSAQSGLDVEVWYGHRAGGKEQADAGFGVEFQWDSPLYDGYSYKFLKNMAARPSLFTFNGIDTPEVKRLIEERRLMPYSYQDGTTKAHGRRSDRAGGRLRR